MQPVPPLPVRVPTQREAVAFLTREEVLEQSHPDSLCLLIIKEQIYDCTKWQHSHPGGHLTVRALCGKDATDSFSSAHSMFIQETWLHKFYYGELKPSSPLLTYQYSDEEKKDDSLTGAVQIKDMEAITGAFRELTQTLKEAGMFETRYPYYYLLVARFAVLFGLVLVGVFGSDQLWVHALAGITLGFFWQQVAFLGHDLGHNAVTHDRITDSFLGIFFGNFCTGIGTFMQLVGGSHLEKLCHVVRSYGTYASIMVPVPFTYSTCLFLPSLVSPSRRIQESDGGSAVITSITL